MPKQKEIFSTHHLNIRNDQLALEDTLLYPRFKEGDRLKKFDVVIAKYVSFSKR